MSFLNNQHIGSQKQKFKILHAMSHEKQKRERKNIKNQFEEPALLLLFCMASRSPFLDFFNVFNWNSELIFSITWKW